ncbi:MAG: 6-phospho-beta-glucosidase, partial [Eubacteriales bacterium]
MRELKLAVIGAGSTYSPEIFEGIINRRDMLNVKRVSLMDIDERKLNIVGGLIKRMLSAGNIGAEVELTTDLDRALDGADYVIAQIRVGRLPARVLDERIPLKYGLIGQETTGIGGFFKALRTIPQILNVAKRMEVLCPDAVLINFSNPSGLVAEAVQNNSSITMTGL